MLLNLITNARDAMSGQGGGVITVELAQRGGRIELVVSDTGSTAACSKLRPSGIRLTRPKSLTAYSA